MTTFMGNLSRNHDGSLIYKAIVVGVSAGGVNALQKLIPALPINIPWPVVVVQHRRNERNDFLTPHLDSLSKVNVLEAEQGQPLKRGNVYIAPSGYHLYVEDDETFSLSLDPPVCYCIPAIDVLFDSAADVFAEKLVGIVLTGANNDGSEGLKNIRAAGGLAIVQNPETADTATMPASAIAVAGADYVFNLDEISEFLIRLAGKGKYE